ncbi:MAG: hypothetical protein HZB61_10180 [Nitrospirae bacterium]|nr:hypothetical protein [Nitrospirota bacterium]
MTYRYECGCIEIIVETPLMASLSACPLHNARGVAELIDCVKGRPIKCWITNNECDERRLCPASYDDCQYKWRRNTQGNLI